MIALITRRVRKSTSASLGIGSAAVNFATCDASVTDVPHL